MAPIFEPVLLVPAAVLLAVLFILLIPVTISFSIVRRESCSATITIGWLYGLLRFTPSVTGRRDDRRRPKRPASPRTEPEEAPRKAPPKAPRSTAKRFIRLLKSRGFVRGVLKLLHGLTGCVRIVSLHVAGRIGLDDPCDTGRLWGSICAFLGFLHGSKRVRFQVEPEFNEAVFELDGRGEIRFIPFSLFLPAARFVLSPATLRAAWAASRRTG